MAKPFDPKAKARKQKIVAGVLGVVLLGVLVFQGPTILGLFGGGSSSVKSEPAPASTATASPTPAVAAPAAAAAPASATPAAGGSTGLIDSDVTLEPGQGQLVTFDRFESKDPFAPQLADKPATPAAPPVSAPARRENAPKPAFRQTPPRPAIAVRSATISVNGVSSHVGVSGTFPEGDPIFKLVSLTKTTAKVGIVDGTYATGSPAIALRRGGKPVTLMNTADGTTYVLRLVDVD